MSRRPAHALPRWHLNSGTPLPASGAFVALVPGEHAPLHTLEIPGKLRSGLRFQVARSQLESLFQEGLEGLDIRIGNAAALVTQADTARDWRLRVQPAGRRMQALLPDYLALPAVPDAWVLSCSGARLLARLGPCDGFAAPVPIALAQLRAALAQGDKPSRAYVLEAADARALHALLEAAEIPVEDQLPGGAEDGKLDADALAFNLARDPAADRAEMQLLVRRWRRPLVAMLLGAGLLGGALWTDTQRLTKAARTAQSESRSLARQAFLPSGPILDLRQQVARVIAARQGQGTQAAPEARPLDALHAAAEILAAQQITIRRVQQAPGALLRMDLDVADFARLEELTGLLEQAGAGARVVSSSAQAGAGVTALIEFEPVPAGGRP